MEKNVTANNIILLDQLIRDPIRLWFGVPLSNRAEFLGADKFLLLIWWETLEWDRLKADCSLSLDIALASVGSSVKLSKRKQERRMAEATIEERLRV